MNQLIKELKKVKNKYFPSNALKQFENKKQVFYGQFISSNDLVFDVGANIGNRTEIFLQLGAKVIAIEPQKKCYTHLERKFGNKILLITKGVGEKEELKDFYISNESVLSSFSKEWIDSTTKSGRFGKSKWNKVESIEMTTLDLIIQEHGTPSFIKIDVEGYELEVLKGLSVPINNISFEYTVPEQTLKIVECMKQIEKINGGSTLFNYSIGESMQLSMNKWINTQEMIKLINSQEFSDTVFGDIYAQKYHSTNK